MKSSLPEAAPETDKTAVTMGAISASTLIGFSATSLTLLLTLRTQTVNPGALYWALALLVITVAFFAIAIEFYTSAAWQGATTGSFSDLALAGSACYSFGFGFLVDGFGLMILALFSDTILPYVPAASFLAGVIALYVVRGKLAKATRPYKRRVSYLRAILVSELVLGMVVIWVLQRG